ncbi:MAG: hypothetical protein ABFS39_10835 [Pseudomonadota bacterium]
MSKTPLLQPVVPQADQAMVDEIFGGVEAHVGFIPDGMKLYSISPPVLQTFVQGVGYFLGHESLSQELLAMIRYLGSSDAGCEFCISLNEGFLANMGVDLDSVRAARSNPDAAPLTDEEKVLLKLALKGITAADDISAENIENARNAGWNDRQIFDVVALAANNRAFNLVLKTFNVEAQGVY